MARMLVRCALVVMVVIGSTDLITPSSYASVATTTTSPKASGTSAPGAKKNVVTFGTQTASATKPDARGYYSFGSGAGGRVEDHVAVINYSNQPITVILRAVDAVNTPQGGFAAMPINRPSKDLGTWVALPASDLTITLSPRTTQIVPFLVAVPKGATPGDHVGAITATLESSIQSKSGQKIHLLQTTGTRIFMRVSGPLHPAFAVEHLSVRYTGTINPLGTGSAVLTYTVRNTGNVALGGRQTVYVSGLFGSKRSAAHVAEVQLLLPGYTVKESVRLSDVIPELRDTGHVSITPLYIPGTVQPASGPFTASLSFWAVPWIVVIVIALLLALLVWLYLRHRRRRLKAKKGMAGGPKTPSGAAAEDATTVTATARDGATNGVLEATKVAASPTNDHLEETIR